MVYSLRDILIQETPLALYDTECGSLLVILGQLFASRFDTYNPLLFQ